MEVFFMVKKKTKTQLEFNIVNIYKHEEYFDRIRSVKPCQALRLHALLMQRMNGNSHSRKTNTILAKTTDDAAKLGISRATYQKYKVALINARLWEFNEKFKNHHRIAGDWHVSEDLLDDPYDKHVSRDDTSKNTDLSRVEVGFYNPKNGKNKKHVSRDDTSKGHENTRHVSRGDTSRNADLPRVSKNNRNENKSKNKGLVSRDDTSLVSRDDTYIYSIVYKDIIDDDDITKLYNQLIKNGFPGKYTGKVLHHQLVTFKRVYNKLTSKQRKEIFDKLYYSIEKPEKDVLNYLIKCGKNQLKTAARGTKKSKYQPRRKKVEKGTDWSKKKAEDTGGYSTDELKELFKNLNNK